MSPEILGGKYEHFSLEKGIKGSLGKFGLKNPMEMIFGAPQTQGQVSAYGTISEPQTVSCIN